MNEDPSVPVGSIFSSSPKWGAVATFTPKDADGNQFEYRITEKVDGFAAYVGINAVTGELWLGDGFNYESLTNPNVTFTIYARGISGPGDPAGGAVSDTITLSGKDGYISTLFVLSIANVNDESMSWAGVKSSAAISETAGVEDQELITDPTDYKIIATLTPKDPDGDGFRYAIDRGKDQQWLFDDIGTDGVLKLKYNLDYESTVWTGNVVKTTIWATGTGGGDAVGSRGTAWVPHEFALTILNVEEDSSTDGINNSGISWDGVSASAAISETTGVENQSELTEANYKTIATLTPKDDDGDGFQYGIEGDQADLFTIGSDGELKLKYNLDYESNLYPPVIKIAIWGHGTSGGTAGGVGAGTAWRPHEFTLTILNVGENTNVTAWSGTQPSFVTVNEDTTVGDGYFEVEGKPPIAIATFTPIDADGDQFEYVIRDYYGSLVTSSQFTIDSDGVLYSRTGFNYENYADSEADTNHKFPMTIYVRGITGGNPSGDAVAGDTQSLSIYGTGYGNGWITTAFVLSIVDVEPERNYNTLSWAGVSSTATISETADVENQELIADSTNYFAIATLTPSDADGDGFEYAIDRGKDQHWLFADIGSDGVLKVRYELDYESAWYPPVVKTTIWGHGTAGDSTNAAGAVWLPFEFTLTILNVNENGVNDEITSWSGTPTTDASWRETINVENQGPELSASEYVAVGTFKPLDDDGTEFEYAFDTSKAGFWLFDYDTSTGVISVKYQLDYESAWYPPIVETTLWIHGTSGGTATGDGTAWISHNFTLSILNVNEATNDQATEWGAAQQTSAVVAETRGVDNQQYINNPNDWVKLATLIPTDADGNEFQYAIDGGRDQHWLFDISQDGVLSLKWNLDYESQFWSGNVVKTTIWANGTLGGTPVGDAVPWVSHNFALTILNVDDDGINNKKTAWSGNQLASVSVGEDDTITGTASVSAGETPVAIATFAAIDADGNAFEYDVQLNNADTNYFSIDSDGVLYTTAGFNYEGTTLVDAGYKYDLKIYARGISDGAPVGDAVAGTSTINGEAGWITTSFTVNITDFDEDSTNNKKTEWSGTQPAGAAVNEDTDVNDDDLFAVLDTPVAITTFTPIDGDGNEFEYYVSLGTGNTNYNTFLTVDDGGVLYIKYGYNYEDYSDDGGIFSLTIWARGTSGGTPTGDAVADTRSLSGESGWIVTSFVLSIVDVDESTTADGGTSIFVGNANQDGVYDNVVFANLNYTNDDTNPIKIDSASDLENSFISFTDADGNQNQHHWYFIADDVNDGTGYIVFDVDGDGAGNDQIHIFGEGNWNWGTPSEGDGIFETPAGLANDGGLTHQQFLDLLGNPTINDGNFV
ncbi:MAG: hypothetical protein ACR2PV_02270 [Gammaproteobacteria bacterium]